MGKLSLNTAEGTRIELTKKQQTQIQRLYKRVSKDIGQRAEKIPRTNSEALRQQYLKKLQSQINEQLENIGHEIEGTITQNMTQVAFDVVDDNLKWLESIGMPVGGAFSHVPDDVVRAVATGKVYAGKWSLSSAIWGTTEKAQKDINTVIAEGIAQNKSAYDIAKDLEKYVDPSAKKDWSWSKVYPGTNKKVDYNAQRLARTLVSHAYQQAFVKTTQKNPFVTKYKWLGSNSHRICPICAARDGKLFEKNELPLDHPNGMCTFVAVMEDSMEGMADRLADWAQGKEDPALDAYAKDLFPGVDLSMVKNHVGSKSTNDSEDSGSHTQAKPYDGLSPDKWIDKNLTNLRRGVTRSFGKDSWSQLREELLQLPEEKLRWMSRGDGYCKKIYSDGGKGYFSILDKTISLDLIRDIKGTNKATLSTLYHEWGHLLDYKLYRGAGYGQISGQKSYGKTIYKLLVDDYNKLIHKSPTGKDILNMDVRITLLDMDKYSSGAQDIISGLSKDELRVRWGHSKEYWTRKAEKDQWKEVTSEAFAHLNHAYMDPDVGEIFQEYFPQAYKYFVEEIVPNV